MLSPGIVVVLLVGVTAGAVWAGWSRRSLFIAIGVLEVLGLLLLGLPGAAFLETLQPMMERAGRGSMSADGAWPAAILMSILWPTALIPAYFLARRIHAGKGPQGFVTFVVLILGSTLIGVLAYGVATS
jgi:hypothetical protein